MKTRIIALAFAAALMAASMTGCGAASMEDISGTYVCTDVLVNLHGTSAGYKQSDVTKKYLGMEIDISANGVLTMDGQTYALEKPEKSGDSTNFHIVGNGYSDAGSGTDWDFDGPMDFYYIPKGGQIAADLDAESDYIHLYYSPSGTTEWCFAFDFYKED